jgi:hypothetical protein
LTDWRAGKNTREATVAEISRRFQVWVHIFESARTS